MASADRYPAGCGPGGLPRRWAARQREACPEICPELPRSEL